MQARIRWRKKRKLARKRAKSRQKRRFLAGSEFDRPSRRGCRCCGSAPREMTGGGLQMHVQDGHVILQTSDNMSLTWRQSQNPDLNSEPPRSAPKVTTNSPQQCKPHPEEEPVKESSDVVIVEDLDVVNGQQKATSSTARGVRSTAAKPKPSASQTRTHPETSTAPSLPSRSDPTSGVEMLYIPKDARQPSSAIQAESSKTNPSSRPKKVSHCAITPIISTMRHPLKRKPIKLKAKSKSMPLKSRMSIKQRHVERSQGKGPFFPQRKLAQRKTTTNSDTTLQWNEASTVDLTNENVDFSQPVISNVVGGQDAVEMTSSCFDSSPSRQEMQILQEESYQQRDGDVQHDVSAASLEQNAGPSSQAHCLATDNQTEPDHKPGLVTYPLPVAVGPAMDTSSAQVTDEAVGDQTMMVQNVDGVYWSCISDDLTDVGMAMADNPMGEEEEDIPVATDMRPLTTADMTCNGATLSNQKIRLTRGYDVFLTRYDLWKIEKCSKNSWSILTRRLLDVYFDRMTLAMGRASHHGSNGDHKPLDQNVVGAIRDEDEMEDADDDDEEEDGEDEEPSLQELAVASLEEEEDEDDDDDWKPTDGKMKRKKKQKEKKDTKRQHLEDVESGPRKAKKLALLEMSKSSGDDDDDDEEDDMDFDPEKAVAENAEDQDEESNSSEDDDDDLDSSDEDGEDYVMYRESDSDLEEDEEDEEVADEDAKTTPRSKRAAKDKKQMQRILQSKETKANKSSEKKASLSDKENVEKPQKQPRNQSTPKTQGNKPGQQGKTQGSKTPAADKSPTKASLKKEGKTPVGKSKGNKTPGGKVLRDEAAGSGTPVLKTEPTTNKTPNGKKSAAKTPATPAGTPNGKMHGDSKMDGGGDKKESKTPKVKSDGLTSQTPKSQKKEKTKSQQPVKTPKKVKLPGGTVIEDLEMGDGKVAKSGKMVHVYYQGSLAGNGKEFDSCMKGKPFNFRLGRSEVISGWDTGIVGMKVGGKRRLTVPANQGYGQRKMGPIPSNSTLVFNVTLKNVN